MEIFINKEKIPFELENEKNANDILNEISIFALKLKPQNFIINVYINNKEYSLANEKELRKIKIDDIKNIEISTSDIYGITSLSMDQIENFLKLLMDFLNRNEWDETFTKVADSIGWMKEGINQIVLIFGPNDNFLTKERDMFHKNCDDLKNLFIDVTKDDINVKDNKKINNIMNVLKHLVSDIVSIRKHLVQSFKLPDREYILNSIKGLIKNIDEIIPKLENIPILFQTGEDQESMNIIQALADILERSISLFLVFKETFKLYMDEYTVKEVSFEVFFKTLTNHLKGLMNAMQNNDSVMIGDLLEYEFVPNVEEIKAILVKIKEEAFTKAN